MSVSDFFVFLQYLVIEMKNVRVNTGIQSSRS